MVAPWARFDDLRTGRRCSALRRRRSLTAVRPDEVADVLQQVHDATEAGSWAYGYVAYEAASGLDPQLPGGPASRGEPPLVWFGLCEEPAEVESLTPPGEAGHAARAVAPGLDRRRARRAVASVRDHIAAGETYQCNLTDRLRSTVAGDPRDLYARLALAQRGAYNAYLDLGRHAVASASPELFFEWAGRRRADAADEGHRRPRPHDRRGPGAEPPTCGPAARSRPRTS